MWRDGCLVLKMGTSLGDGFTRGGGGERTEEETEAMRDGVG